MTAKTAVILFNLGGPESLDGVRPFLFNLFNDRAIIPLPRPLRWLAAAVASRRRAPFARKIYQQMGGRSPLLDLTREQRTELEHKLGDESAFRVFIAMRYSQPFIEQTVREVAVYAPDRILLLPLYPQYSTTTTGSSLRAWKIAASAAGLDCPHATVCCYPVQAQFIRAHAQSTARSLTANARPDSGDISGAVLLFSAHGLPKRVIDDGDPYAWQVRQTAAAVVERLENDTPAWRGVDWRVCYQSRVGPLEWIGPYTEDAIVEAAKAGKRIFVVPIAFVSEHSETLVELDIEYRSLAEKYGAATYVRVPALGTHEDFIAALAAMVTSAVGRDAFDRLCSARGDRQCPREHVRCPMTSS